MPGPVLQTSSESNVALRLVNAERIELSDDASNVLRNMDVRSADLPSLQAGEVLVEPLFVGICGSDNSACLGKSNFDWVPRPRTIGHECSARVVELGPNVDESDLQVGDVVCCVPMLGCGNEACRGCRRGRPNYCRKKTILGFHRDGAMAKRMVVEAQRCMKLHDGVSPIAGAVVEPLSVVAQAIHRKCDIQPGMDVIVSGCGIIGLMAAELAADAGARVAVTGVERDRDVRLALAQKQGFIPIVVSRDATLHEQLQAGIVDLNGNRFGDEYECGTVDVLIECSGSSPALANAGASVQLEGHIAVIATFGTEVPFNATAFTRAGQTMSGVMGSNREDFERAQALLQRGVFSVDRYSQVYSFDDVMQAMEDSVRAKTTKTILAINA